MRILVVNYEFPPVGGGGGRVAEEICRVLARRGHKVLVETALLRGLASTEHRDGYVIHRNYSMRKKEHECTPVEMGAYVVLNIVPVLKRIRQWKPDVIHAHFAVPTGIIAYLCKVLSGVPYVLNAYLGDVPGAVPEQTDSYFRWIKPFTVPIWQNAAAVLTGTSFVRDLARTCYRVPIDVIPYAIDLSGCVPGPPKPARPRRLLFAGRFTVQKEPLFLVRTLAAVNDLDWTMEMIGDGPLMEQVRALIALHGLEERIHLRGWVPLEELQAVMTRSDLLVMPSRSESLPLVGMMALGCGVAILGSRIGGLLDFVREDRNGFLVPRGDEKAFAERLRILLVSDSLVETMKQESRNLSREFDIEAIGDRYEKILRTAAAVR